MRWCQTTVHQGVLPQAMDGMTMAQASDIANNTMEACIKAQLWAVESHHLLVVNTGRPTSLVAITGRPTTLVVITGRPTTLVVITGRPTLGGST
jgi:hypothetical protein